MNRTEFIEQIASEMESSNEVAAQFFDAFTTVIQKTLEKGDNITLIGFGQFLVAERSARPARNFKTGKTISIPATKAVKFKPGKGLKEVVVSS